jgi:hypothetical protein
MLVFEDNEQARERFTLLYQGFIAGGNSPAQKGMEVVRREARVLDKLDAVSEPSVNGLRALREGEHAVVLEQPEYELVKRYFENAPWAVHVSRQVVSVSDWLSAIPLA